MDRAKLDAYLQLGKRLFDGEPIEGKNKKGESIYKTLDEREDYKLKLIENLKKARVAVLNDHDNWDTLLMDAVKKSKNNPNNITERGQHAQFRPVLEKWIESDQELLFEAMKALWVDDGKSPGERVHAFLIRELKHDDFQGRAEKLTAIAYLLMALGPDYPPFQWRKLESAYRHLEYLDHHPRGDSIDDLVRIYEHARNFLDQLVQYSDGCPNNLLDAQSLVWTLGGNPEKVVTLVKNKLDILAKELLLPPEFLHEIADLLEDKWQVIFQGPPGTGKTYVARELAECLAGDPKRVELVQFHPSYAYEDFVQGFRPTLEGGSAGFAMRNGPLLRMAKQAFEEPNEKHFLVIDEINRGNLAKVFGELYFLLEYRGEKHRMRLQYSNTEFWMPKNLYIIGTMNTADRSIALVDAALRRRFYFVPFHPNEEPIKGLLKEWLEREAKKREAEERKWSDEMEWLPGVVDAANKKLSEKLGNEETAIGPSYFMKGDIPEKMERVWKYNVLPYIEEQMYDQRGRVKDDFALKALKEEAARVSAPQAEGATEQGDPDESAPDGGEG